MTTGLIPVAMDAFSNAAHAAAGAAFTTVALSIASRGATNRVSDSLMNIGSSLITVASTMMRHPVTWLLSNLATTAASPVPPPNCTGVAKDLSCYNIRLDGKGSDGSKISPKTLDCIAQKCGNDKNYLFLQNNNLEGPFEDYVSALLKLPNLRLLFVYNQPKLTGTIPNKLFQLTKLVALSIVRTEVSGSIPSSIDRLASLQELRLNYNSLTGTIPSSLETLPIQVAFFGSNNFTNPVPCFKEWRKLKYLSLANNPLLSGNISTPPSLEYLNIQGTHLQNTTALPTQSYTSSPTPPPTLSPTPPPTPSPTPLTPGNCSVLPEYMPAWENLNQNYSKYMGILWSACNAGRLRLGGLSTMGDLEKLPVSYNLMAVLISQVDCTNPGPFEVYTEIENNTVNDMWDLPNFKVNMLINEKIGPFVRETLLEAVSIAEQFGLNLTYVSRPLSQLNSSALIVRYCYENYTTPRGVTADGYFFRGTSQVSTVCLPKLYERFNKNSSLGTKISLRETLVHEILHTRFGHFNLIMHELARNESNPYCQKGFNVMTYNEFLRGRDTCLNNEDFNISNKEMFMVDIWKEICGIDTSSTESIKTYNTYILAILIFATIASGGYLCLDYCVSRSRNSESAASSGDGADLTEENPRGAPVPLPPPVPFAEVEGAIIELNSQSPLNN